MFNFQKQAAFEAKLAQVYHSLTPEFKAEVSQQDFILEFPIIEVNGQAAMLDKPDPASAFLLTDEAFEQVIAAFKSIYEPQ
ncbi:hypothetical protein [Hymenobacter sp. BT730]|uniref:hypothetical protein n=1 Tax=Hymenobacter sp. BT730 TaxID=3063332 RepID=UPI0026E0B55D|nr:hypothetical protein [Hymenobacter sp. BT730]